MKAPKFHVYPAKGGWRWHLKSANGRILAQGEAHTRQRDAIRAIDTLRATMTAWPLIALVRKGGL